MFIKYVENEKLVYIKTSSSILPSEVEITEKEYKQLSREINEHMMLISDYASRIVSGLLDIEEVPTEYYQEVYEIINASEPQPEPVTYTLDEAAAILASEVNE